MKNNEEQSNPKDRTEIDWKAKGLGWIPDYPDARDYCLGDVQEEGKLKKEGTTDSIESIAEVLIKSLRLLSKELSHQNEILSRLGQAQLSQSETVTNYLDTLEDKLLGNIDFKEVRIYKILREKTVAPKEIAQIKTYLAVLLQYKYIQYDHFEESPDKFLSWFNDKEFDPITKELVKRFQQMAEVKPSDGVVGLNTYAALDTVLNDLKNRNEPLKKTKAQNEAQLLSVPSLLPQEFFREVLKQLKCIKFEVCKVRKRSEIDEWEEFLKNAGNLHDIDSEDDDLVLELARTIDALDDRFSEVFYNEFYTIDSLISFILEILSPVAQFETIAEAIDVGIKRFISIIGKLYACSDCYGEYLKDDFLREFYFEKYLDENLINLANATCKKLKKLLAESTKNVVDGDESRASKLTTLYFYFLLNEFTPEDQRNESNDQKHNCTEKISASILHQKTESAPEEIQEEAELEIALFDKKELFEITKEIADDCSIDSSSSEARLNTSQFSKFNNLSFAKLQIPISRNLYRSKAWLTNKRSRQYLFLPDAVDLSFWCPEVEDQGKLNSCTAFAGVALIEYFANRSLNKYTSVSPLFLYKAARNLGSQIGDMGATVRDTMKAMTLFGVPPEQYWSYQEELVDDEPPPFCYAFAQNYQTLKFFRLDNSKISTETLLFQIKAVLAAGFPCMFGFTVYASAYESVNIENGYFPFPHQQRDKVVGGHAVVAVGYSDYKTLDSDRKLVDTNSDRGALLIRNSWGTKWGQGGYGWLPYQYVLQGLTGDWWSLTKSEWFDQDQFGLGAPAWISNVGGNDGPLPTGNSSGNSGGNGGKNPIKSK
jgi:C1A family cysteine protease